MAAIPINFGITGCADIAIKMSRAMKLAPNSSLYAIGSRSLETAKRFVTENDFPAFAKIIYGSYEDILNDPLVDAVYMPLPTTLHLKWAVMAAEKKKHLLLEKPTALNVKDLDQILDACDANGVQFMDTTMWMHHPRTEKMKNLISDSELFGELKSVHSVFTFTADPYFLKNNIRVKPDLDALGALGDVGWYCIRMNLWAANYELPKTVTAFPGAVCNDGLILSCGSSFFWEDGKVATFQCSFQSHLSMDALILGSKGSLHLQDFVIPYKESHAAYTFGNQCSFTDLVTEWKRLPITHTVHTNLPQEALMIDKFSRLVKDIKSSGSKPDKKWSTITRKTQIVLDAVKTSIEKGFVPVEVQP